MLKIAIPNKGSLSEEAVRIISNAGYNVRRMGRELMLSDEENDVEFVFLRPRDIAIYVSNGVLDLGITGRDLAVDSGAEVAELLPLGFGKANFYYAVPDGSILTPDRFNGLCIATSYPNLVAADLEKRGVKARIVRLDGAIEISIELGVADLIADVVQTGKTMKEAGLKTVGEPVIQSEAVLIGRNGKTLENPAAQTFLERLRGIVVAREYVMVEYDVAESKIAAACDVTPGIEAPTVSPLRKEGWVAVKAMSRKRDINRIMDDLSALDARGIIVTDIKTCRI